MVDATEDEILLTAFLDGELPSHERGALEMRLSNEPRLCARLGELRQGGASMQSAMAAALDAAPRASMTAKLAAPRGWRYAAGPVQKYARAAVVAAVAFIAGLAASRAPPLGGSREPEGWRESVAEYMSLYSAASFAPREEAVLRDELGSLSQRVGVDLSESRLRYGALAPRSGLLLQFKGAPLAQIGYLIDGAPAAFCVIRDGEADAAPASVRLGNFNVVSWAGAGHGFMVVSAASAVSVAALARALRDQTAAN